VSGEGGLARLTPVALERGAAPAIDWGDLSGIALAEPFFDQSVERWAGGDPPPRLVRTGWDALERLDGAAALDPALIIFHLSRCGSTLVSRALATHEAALVLSEPGTLNSFLMSDWRDADAADRALWLRRLVRALGRGHGGAARVVLLKLSSWNVMRLALFRQAFPAARLLWLQRAPAEVMASILATPPGWAALRRFSAQAEMVFGLPASEAARLDPEEFCARALAAMLEAARQAQAAGAMLVDYRELPGAIWRRVAPFAGLAMSAESERRMTEESRFSAKERGRHLFTGDPPRPLSDRARDLAERLAGPGYRALDAARPAAPG
jgi:hypothetical protein